MKNVNVSDSMVVELCDRTVTKLESIQFKMENLIDSILILEVSKNLDSNIFDAIKIIEKYVIAINAAKKELEAKKK